ISGRDQQHARNHSRWLWIEGNYPKMLRPLSSLVEQFAPVPDWTPEAIDTLKKTESKKWGGRDERGDILLPSSAGVDVLSRRDSCPALANSRGDSGNNQPATSAIIYYTDCLLADPIYEACQRQLSRAAATRPLIR